MLQYINKVALIAEIERRIKAIPRGETDKRLKAVYGNEAFVLNDLLSFIDTLEVKEVDLKETTPQINNNKGMIKEIKISGEIKDILHGENRAIYSDCGGAIYIRDYILRECGGYSIGGRITISIAPCEKDEYHYPPKPSI